MFKVVIFDMDGVLVDDFFSWMEFDKKFLSGFGIVPDNEYIKFVNGRSEEEVVHWVKERYCLQSGEEEIMASRQKWIKKIYKVDSEPMAGVEKLLKKIKKNNLKLALCSGAKMWQIKIILDRFDWRVYFEVVVSSDHVGYKGKPNPEIYSHTARLLKIAPADCVVVEDAENGVAAAKSAGMKCIGYKDLRFDLPDDLAKADLVVESLGDGRILDYIGI